MQATKWEKYRDGSQNNICSEKPVVAADYIGIPKVALKFARLDAAKTFGAAFITAPEPFAAAAADSPLSSGKTAVSIQLDTVPALPGGAMVPLATVETEPTEVINHCK